MPPDLIQFSLILSLVEAVVICFTSIQLNVTVKLNVLVCTCEACTIYKENGEEVQGTCRQKMGEFIAIKSCDPLEKEESIAISVGCVCEENSS